MLRQLFLRAMPQLDHFHVFDHLNVLFQELREKSLWELVLRNVYAFLVLSCNSKNCQCYFISSHNTIYFWSNTEIS